MTILQPVFPFSHDGRLSAPWGEGLGAPGQAGPGRPIPSHPQPRQLEGSPGRHQEPPWGRDGWGHEPAGVGSGSGLVQGTRVGHSPGMARQGHGGGSGPG